MDEKTQTVLSYSYGRDYYESPLIQDDISHSVNAGLVYDLGKYFPSTKGRVNMGYSYFHYPTSWNNSFSATVGFSRNIKELWSISLDGGTNYVVSEVTVNQLVPVPGGLLSVRRQQSNYNWGWTGTVSLNYTGEYINGGLSYSNGLSVSPGLNGAAQLNSVALTGQYRFTYEFSSLHSISYTTYKANSSNYSSNVVQQKSLFVNNGFRYEFSREMAVEASYGYTRVSCPASTTEALNCPASTTNTVAERHVVSLSFYFQRFLFE